MKSNLKYVPFLTLDLFAYPDISLLNFKCPLCGGILYNPVKDSCGHYFCFHCIYQYKLTSRICPLSTYTFQNTNNYPDIQLKHFINNKIIQCKNFNLGCSWTGLVGEYQKHLEKECALQRSIFPNQTILGLKREDSKKKSLFTVAKPNDEKEKEKTKIVEFNPRIQITDDASTSESNHANANGKEIEENNLIKEKEINNIMIWLDIEKNQYFDLKNSQEIEVRNNGIITKGNSTMPKFVFSLLSFNPNDNKKYKWKVRISVKSNIVFIGMCNKAKVIENNYIVSGIGEFKSGLYGVSTNCILWNSSNKKENLKSISNMKEDIKEATIALEYQPQLKTLNIMFLEINFKVSINKIEEENILSPCFFYYTDGNEIDFIE